MNKVNLTFLLALVGFFTVASAFDAQIAIRFDSFQLDRRYGDIAITGVISHNATFYVRGETIDSPTYDQIFTQDSKICSRERCYDIPLLTNVLDGAAYLFCQDNDFFAPARLFPMYKKTGADGNIHDATLDDVLRKNGAAVSTLKPSRDALMFAVFAPASEQNYTLLTHGIVKFSQFSAKDTNASATFEGGVSIQDLQSFSVNVSRCVIRVLSEEITFGAPDGEEIDFTAPLVYPKQLVCNLTVVQELNNQVFAAASQMASATDPDQLDAAYESALSALSNPSWSACNWLAESLIRYKDQPRTIPNTTDCWETYGTETYARDPCCNQTLLWSQCCAPKNQSTTVVDWDGWQGFLAKSYEASFLTTSPPCQKYTLPEFMKSVDDGSPTNKPTRMLTALNDWALWKRRSMDPVRGCESIPFYSEDLFTAVRSIFASCLEDLYGKPIGTGRTCFNDASCPWDLECNEVTRRCDIPWEDPSLPLAKCILDRKKQYIHQYFLWLLKLPQTATVEELRAALRAQFAARDCAGPTATDFSFQMKCYSKSSDSSTCDDLALNATGCVEPHACNWNSCPSANLEGKTCEELCEDPQVPGDHVCGWCSEGDFGQCFSVSEVAGCITPSALSRNECSIYASFNNVSTYWEPLERVCYITSIQNKAECLASGISCLAPAPTPPQRYLRERHQSNIASSKAALINSLVIDEKDAPGAQFVTNPNWNRTVCPQTCFDSNRGQAECHDENCDHPCCDRDQVCQDAAVRACVCNIDAFCCDNWDDDCNRKVIDSACVNCNCIRRSWDPLMNSGNGLCKVLVAHPQICEDPFQGNGTWVSGRAWREGRFSTRDRCDEGACDTDITADSPQCNAREGCDGPLCRMCRTSIAPGTPQYATASQACEALTANQCYQCSFGQPCAINQTINLCTVREEPCASKALCERNGRCSDEDYLVSDSLFGRCVVDFVSDENSTAVCPQAAVALTLTPIGCIATNITSPDRCNAAVVGVADAGWKMPSLDMSGCLLPYQPKCIQPQKDLGEGIFKTVETWGKSCGECVACGGQCETATTWMPSSWRVGRMIPMRWMPRSYSPLNQVVTTLDSRVIKSVLEKAIHYRLRDSLASDVLCRYSGLGATLFKIADICTTTEAQQKHHSALRHPAVIAQRTLFWNQSATINIEPAYVEIQHDAIEDKSARFDIRVTLFSMMDAYVNGSSPAKRDLAIDVVRLEPSGYLFGQLIGDGIMVEIFDASKPNMSRTFRPGTAKLCFDVRNHPDQKWRQIYPVADLATLSTVVPSEELTQKFQAFVPLMVESSRNLSEFMGLYYEYNETTRTFERMCISLNGTGVWYPATRMAAVAYLTAWLPYVAIGLFTIVFGLAVRKFIWMLVYDRTRHRLVKPIASFAAIITAASRIVLMIIVVRFKWQRAYPEDFLMWNGFDWTAKIFVVFAVELFIGTNDTISRARYCDNPLRWLWISIPAQIAVAAVFLVGFMRQFPLPAWSQEVLEEFYRGEYLFNYVIAGAGMIAFLGLGLLIVIQGRTRRGRILTSVITVVGLLYYIRIIVWTRFDTFFGNLTQFWVHMAEIMLYEVIMLAIVTWFHDVGLYVPTEEDLAVELDQKTDYLPLSDDLERRVSSPTLVDASLLPDLTDEEVERQFAEMLLTLGLPFDKVEAMLALPIRQKRALLAEHLRDSPNAPPSRSRGVQSTPEYNLHALQSADVPNLQDLRRLRLELSAAPSRWVKKFIEIGGAEALFRIMNALHDKADRGKKKIPISPLLEECVRCLHYLLREVSQAQRILELPRAPRAVVLCLRFAPFVKNANKHTKIFTQSGLATLTRIVCLMCVLPGLHSKVLDELMLIRENQKKKNRFANIVLRLTDRTVGLDSRVEYMTLINAIVNAPEDVWARNNIRKQLNLTGMKEAIKILKDHPSNNVYAELDLQISVYEDETRADDKQLTRRRGAGVFTAVKDVDLADRKTVDADDLFSKIIHEATQRGQTALLMPILSELLRLLQSGAKLDNVTLGGLLAALGGGFGPGQGGGPGTGSNSSTSSLILKTSPPLPEDATVDSSDGPPPPPPGVPPPPPPPGGKKVAPPPIPVPEPKIKLRPLHWAKVNMENTKGTVFDEIGKGLTAEQLKIDFVELENLFAANPAKEMKKKGGKMDTDAPAKTKLQLLSQKTSQNLAIFLSKFKKNTHDDIINAILAWDQNFLESDSLKQLEYFSSPAVLGEELGPIKDYLANGGAESELGDPELFMLRLAKLPALALQLRAFSLSLVWSGRVSEYFLQLKQINQAATSLMSSAPLKRFYALLLTMGNFLNYGTNKAASHGFALSTFSKMRDLRSTDGSRTTLLAHALNLIHDKHPDLVSLLENELDLVAAVSQLPFEFILGEANQLAANFAQIKSEASALDPAQQGLIQNINNLLKAAETPVGNLKALCAEARTTFEMCCSFFFEDAKKITAEVVFRTFASLSTAFAEIKSARERAAANAARREKLEKNKEANKRKKDKEPAEDRDDAKPVPKQRAESSSDTEDARNAVDDFQKRLREGRVIRAAQAESSMITLEIDELEREIQPSNSSVEYVQ